MAGKKKSAELKEKMYFALKIRVSLQNQVSTGALSSYR